MHSLGLREVPSPIQKGSQRGVTRIPGLTNKWPSKPSARPDRECYYYHRIVMYCLEMSSELTGPVQATDIPVDAIYQ